VFVATGLAAGVVPHAAATLVLEPTDLDERIEQHLPDPGPETVLRGTTSDLLLALWHRRDPVSLYVGGDEALLERWPHT
jgi:MDMPI C-terminal domain